MLSTLLCSGPADAQPVAPKKKRPFKTFESWVSEVKQQAAEKNEHITQEEAEARATQARREVSLAYLHAPTRLLHIRCSSAVWLAAVIHIIVLVSEASPTST
jgi:hypothetical protein